MSVRIGHYSSELKFSVQSYTAFTSPCIFGFTQ